MSSTFIEEFERDLKREEEKEKLLSRLPKGWTGDEIMNTQFPPIKWAVDNLIPTGTILFSGAFKIGKSWAMLQLCDCISKGIPFLGRKTQAGTVLYLALEDGPQRIQSRAIKMGIILSEDIHIYNDWPAGEDGLNSLNAWIQDHNGTRLVIIDTLSRWRDDYRGSDIWQRDTSRIANLKAIADRWSTTFLVVHHRSKASREDVHQSVAGTNALQGAADGSIILDKKRGENVGKLSILGRDVPEAEIAVEFQPESCTWKALDGDPAELMLNQERRAILDAIRVLGGRAKPGQIAERLGKERSNISHLLLKMVERGEVVAVGAGVYATVTPIHSVHSVHGFPIASKEAVNDVNGVNGVSSG